MLLFFCMGDIELDRNQEQNSMKLYSTIFLVVGIFVLVFAFLNFRNALYFNLNSSKTTAKISNVVTLHDKNNKEYLETLVDFKVGNLIYNNVSTRTHIFGKDIGDDISIYYSNKDHYNIDINKKSYIMSIFLFTLGILLFISSSLSYRRIKKRKAEIEQLIQENEFVVAQITDIKTNTGLRLTGRSPLYIRCEYIFNSQKIVFLSDNIWIPLKDDILGTKLKVYYNKSTNFKTYYVDTRNLYA